MTRTALTRAAAWRRGSGRAPCLRSLPLKGLLFSLVAASAALLGGCSGENAGSGERSSDGIVKIAISTNGQVTLNGEKASLDDARRMFAELAEHEGVVVWYYREAAETEPHPMALQVLELVVEAELPISMSTKPDFSDVVMADGTTRPR